MNLESISKEKLNQLLAGSLSILCYEYRKQNTQGTRYFYEKIEAALEKKDYVEIERLLWSLIEGATEVLKEAQNNMACNS